MGSLGGLKIFKIDNENTSNRISIPLFSNYLLHTLESKDPISILEIEKSKSKISVATWSYESKYIVIGHENGSVSLYESNVSVYYYISRV